LRASLWLTYGVIAAGFFFFCFFLLSFTELTRHSILACKEMSPSGDIQQLNFDNFSSLKEFDISGSLFHDQDFVQIDTLKRRGVHVMMEGCELLSAYQQREAEWELQWIREIEEARARRRDKRRQRRDIQFDPIGTIFDNSKFDEDPRRATRHKKR
jgi:hypothetical protein